LIGTGAAGFCALAMAGRLPAAEGRRRPNVLIVTTDQQRIDAMSAVGNNWVKTPHMDALAANGVCFTKSYCPYPLCSPSRAALHTSRMPHEIGVDYNSMAISAGVPTFGQVFNDAGYDAGYSGKWHLPASYPRRGIRGFEVLNRISRPGKLAQTIDEEVLNAAIEFIRREREKPFLTIVSFNNPHDICWPAVEEQRPSAPSLDRLWERYQPSAGAELPPLPANFGYDRRMPDFTLTGRREHWDEDQWRRYIYAYYRMVEDVDRQVGLMVQAVRDAGQEDDTLIIFTSDHGEGLGSHGRTGKNTFYEESAAVPLVISWKGVIPAGRMDREHLVSTLDVLPTICDYAGVRGPVVMRGQSLRSVIEKPQQPGHEYVVTEITKGPTRNFMVRTKRYKYMVFPGTERHRLEMFFDMETDPDEMKNLAGQPAVATELDRHRKLLAEWNALTEEADHPVRRDPKAPRDTA
jgi:arylsulfatase A-like enzyme